jgi:hypothetical protein
MTKDPREAFWRVMLDADVETLMEAFNIVNGRPQLAEAIAVIRQAKPKKVEQHG